MKLKVGDIVRRTDKYDREHPGARVTSKFCVVTEVDGHRVGARPLLFTPKEAGWIKDAWLVLDAWEVVGHIEATPLEEAHPTAQVETEGDVLDDNYPL